MDFKTQKINGTMYAYIDKPFWDSSRKRGDHKREYIGKIIDGEFVPNKRYKLAQELEKQAQNTKPGPVPTEKCLRQFYGATYLLDKIGEKTGITADLEYCFGKYAKELLSVAYYLVLEEGLPMYRFPKWGATHKHPCGYELVSQRISDLFGKITEKDKMEYFQRQAKRRLDKEYLAFDATSISSYSELLTQAKYGKNKEGDALPQINLALLYGQSSMLPVYYRKLPGNITDVKTIHNLVKDIDFLELEKLNLVMDRGFYSEDNINDLMKHHHKFLIGLRSNLKLVTQHLDKVRNGFVTRANYNSELHLYVQSYKDELDYTEVKPRSKDVINEKRRIYVHIYFNDQHATDDRDSFNHMLDRYEEELRTGNRKPEHEPAYAKYFIISQTPVRGIKISYNEEAIQKAEKNFGYFVLLSNGIKDSVEAIKVYRTRDLIEKSFGNLKERLNMRRMFVSSEENFEGKLFVQFIALEFLSYIKKQMDAKGLFSSYTMQSLLDTLDIIEYYQQPGKASHLSEITAKQKELYELLEIEPPGEAS